MKQLVSGHGKPYFVTNRLDLYRVYNLTEAQISSTPILERERVSRRQRPLDFVCLATPSTKKSYGMSVIRSPSAGITNFLKKQ